MALHAAKIWFGGFLLLVAGCRPQELHNDQLNSLGQARLSTSAGAMEVSYEMETMTRHEVISAGHNRSAALDAIYNAPTFSHSSVHLKVMDDGSVESEIQFLESEQEREVMNRHKTGRDPSPKITKVVMKGGQLSFYDATGKLKGNRSVQAENFKAQVEEMKAAKNKSKANKSMVAKATGLPGLDVDMLLELAKAKNARIKDVGNAGKEIEMDIDDPAQSNGQQVRSFRVKHKLDMKRNLLVSTELYDRKLNKLLTRTAMLYKHDAQANADQIQTVYSEEFAENSQTGRREKRITTCHYKNFVLTTNLD